MSEQLNKLVAVEFFQTNADTAIAVRHLNLLSDS